MIIKADVNAINKQKKEGPVAKKFTYIFEDNNIKLATIVKL